MILEQYHEPAADLPEGARTVTRIITSLIEEAQAIGSYEQRLAVETDAEARAIMADAQQEEVKHFSMQLEFLLRRHPEWQEIARGILFQKGDIAALGDRAESKAA